MCRYWKAAQRVCVVCVSLLFFYFPLFSFLPLLFSDFRRPLSLYSKIYSTFESPSLIICTLPEVFSRRCTKISVSGQKREVRGDVAIATTFSLPIPLPLPQPLREEHRRIGIAVLLVEQARAPIYRCPPCRSSDLRHSLRQMNRSSSTSQTPHRCKCS